MSEFCISSLCCLHSVTILLYAPVWMKLNPKSAIPQLSWLCMSAIPSTITGSCTSCSSPSTLYRVSKYLVLFVGGCLNDLLPADSIPSTSDHLFWDRSLESFWVPWDLQSSMASSITIDIFGNTSMSPDRWILSRVQPQHIYSQLLDCTMYLDSHYHHQWDISRLLTVYINYW